MNVPEVSPATAELLMREAARINSREFIADDPVQFPRRFTDKRDIEIAGLLAAIIAWGRRSMICRDAERLMDLMNGEPYVYVREGAFESVADDRNIHRTLFGSGLKHFLRGLRRIYAAHGSIDAFAAALGAGEAEAPAWMPAEAIQGEMQAANGGVGRSDCLPMNMRTTALKRFNMALRWFVRDDGIVDMGIWKSIPKSKLYIPLDVHAGNTARELGLLTRKANDRKSTEELTAAMRLVCPEDPALLDFALFGLGVSGAALE